MQPGKVLPTPLTERYLPELVSIDLIQPNTYNPNVMPDTLFQELLKDIRQQGFVGAIIVRKLSRGYEIVDGEHRYRAAKHLGYTDIPCITLDYEDDAAKFATFRFNHERGFFDNIKTSELIHDLATRHTIDELARELGMAHEEMVQYLRPSEIPASWNAPPAPSPFDPAEDTMEPIILGYADPAEKQQLLEGLDKVRKHNSHKDRVETVKWLLESAESSRKDEKRALPRTGKS